MMAHTSLWILTMLTSVTIALVCSAGKEPEPRDCSEVTGSSNGLYYINPDGKRPFRVYCDMTTDDGGWTVFQRRKFKKKRPNFNQPWAKYKKGFGRLRKSFWLGNEYLHRLTANRSVSLLVEMVGSVEGHATHATANYSNFAVGDETSWYKLTVSGYRKGPAGNALSYHNSMAFTTRDKDNDPSKRNCAKAYGGGWWFRSCLNANLNGKYLEKDKTHGKGIVWLKGKFKSVRLTFSEMKLRPVK